LALGALLTIVPSLLNGNGNNFQWQDLLALAPLLLLSNNNNNAYGYPPGYYNPYQPAYNPYAYQPGYNPYAYQSAYNPYAYNPYAYQSAYNPYAYQPVQPSYGYQSAYNAQNCYNGDGDGDEAYSDCSSAYYNPYAMSSYNPYNYGYTPYASGYNPYTPAYGVPGNAQVSGYVMAQSGPTLLVLTPNMGSVLVNALPAEQTGTVNGSLRPGAFVSAIGYYSSGNTFMATALQ